ncbi:MAG: glycoside hydrolase family 99-like domain-containing protein [Bacteroidia bacterium]|nr:glycoside hydrolase family 99-like domain-containing protein [Bacteroidia bacterium]
MNLPLLKLPIILVFLFTVNPVRAQKSEDKFIDNSPGYDIAVYYFPNYHTDDTRNELRYGKGWSEWELVKNAVPRFEGQHQPKIPLWGYTNESDPRVMEMKINAASQYGIDVFIYDWYYYNDGPFLEKGLEKGFLKAENNNKVKFALMWANHDWVDLFPRNPEIANPPLFYPGTITPETFDRMTDYIISEYFSRPTYWTIDGCPYFSIYELFKFVEGMGGKEQARAALDMFRKKVKKAGFKDLHLNAVVWGVQILPGETEIKKPAELLDFLAFNSTTSYVWVHHVGFDTFPETDYKDVQDKYFRWTGEYVKSIRQPYYPNVTMGWDATPRCSQNVKFANLGYPCMAVLKNNTPENFQSALQTSKIWTDKNLKSNKIITINSWNEWTEGSFLEPEREYGYRYLEAIRLVFGRK